MRDHADEGSSKYSNDDPDVSAVYTKSNNVLSRRKSDLLLFMK